MKDDTYRLQYPKSRFELWLSRRSNERSILQSEIEISQTKYLSKIEATNRSATPSPKKANRVLVEQIAIYAMTTEDETRGSSRVEYDLETTVDDIFGDNIDKEPADASSHVERRPEDTDIAAATLVSMTDWRNNSTAGPNKGSDPLLLPQTGCCHEKNQNFML